MERAQNHCKLAETAIETLKLDAATLRHAKLSKPAMAFVGKVFHVSNNCRVLHLVQSKAVEVPVEDM